MKVFYKTMSLEIISVEVALEFICKIGFEISCVITNIGSIYCSGADHKILGRVVNKSPMEVKQL
jgi:hypothetical protein